MTINLTDLAMSKNGFLTLLENDIDSLTNYLQKISERRFYVGELNLTRKTFLMWVNAGLMPYKFKKEKWSKLSFIEFCWLRCIAELRLMGVSLEKIKKIKNDIFEMDPEEVFIQFKQIANSYKGPVDKKEEIIAIYNDPRFTKKEMAQVLEKLQISQFMATIIHTLATNENICLIYSPQGQSTFVMLGETEEELKKKNEEKLNKLINESFICINLKKIIDDLITNEELNRNDNLAIVFLQPKEKAILSKIREKNAKEIIIRFNDNSEPTHINVKKKEISEEIINKVARYLKKGNYQKIEFKTRDGQLITYDETDVIKL